MFSNREDKSRDLVDEVSGSESAHSKVVPEQVLMPQNVNKDSLDDRITNVVRTGTPPGPLAKTLAELQEKARSGDAESAYALYKALSECESAPRTREVYDQQRHEMSVSSTDRYGRYVNDITDSLFELDGLFRYCVGIGDSQVEEGAYWLWYAAEHNSLEAKTFFLGSRIPAQDSEAVRSVWINERARAALGVAYLKEATDAGVTNAMTLYAFQLLDGDVVGKDPVEGAALLLAVSRLHGDIGVPPGSRQKAALMALSQLPVYEAEEAQQRADEILNSKECCVIFR